MNCNFKIFKININNDALLTIIVYLFIIIHAKPFAIYSLFY